MGVSAMLFSPMKISFSCKTKLNWFDRCYLLVIFRMRLKRISISKGKVHRNTQSERTARPLVEFWNSSNPCVMRQLNRFEGNLFHTLSPLTSASFHTPSRLRFYEKQYGFQSVVGIKAHHLNRRKLVFTSKRVLMGHRKITFIEARNFLKNSWQQT